MPAERPCLLVVDDEAPIREVLSIYFEGQGYEVVCVGDAEAALELAQERKFQAVILDNSLPGMMGITALPQIVKRTKAPVIMITGYPSEQTHRDAILLGAKTLMAKPLDLDQLSAKLREVLAT